MERLALSRRRTVYILLALLLVAALPLTTAHASLVLASPEETSGTGLGAVNTVLTVHDTSDTTASGCVAYDGAMDVVGPAACPPGFAGGDEQTQTQTRTLAEVGVSSAFDLRLVFNYNEPQSDPLVDNITVTDLELTLYRPDGSLCFASGPFDPVGFRTDFSGVGTSGFVFRLDVQQAAAAQPCFDEPDVRAGLAANLEGAEGGLETFYLADAANIGGPAADLELTKTDSPDPVVVNETLTYTLTATNAGPNVATGVTIFDTVPASLSGVTATSPDATCTVSGRNVTCVVGELAPGETATVTITGTPTVTGSITNTATVAGDQPDPETDDNSALEQTEVQEEGGGGGGAPEADLSVLKSDAPDPVVVGETLTYSIRVSNGGPNAATGTTVTDTLPATVTFQSAVVTTGSGTCTRTGRTVTCELGEIASGGQALITIRVTPTETGTITDLVQVSADQEDVNPDNNADGEQTDVVAEAQPGVDLAITKTDSADPVAGGANFTYTLQVTNQGDATATGVVVRDDLPASVTFVSASAGCSHSAGFVVCDLGSVAAGATESVTITVQAPNADVTVTNTATVTADQSDTDRADNAAIEETTVDAGGTPADQFADLSVRKSDTPDPVAVGGQITYTLRITNNGPDAATDVRVIDDLPPQVSFVSTSRPDLCTGSGGTVVCVYPTLAAGETAVLTITVQADTAGTATNTVIVAPGEQRDSNPDNNTGSEQTTIGGGAAREADLSVMKTASPDPVGVGQTLTYTIVVSNGGPDAATGTELVDVLPMAATFESASATQGTCAEAGGVVTCALGTIAAGGTATVQIRVVPTAPGILVNTVAVSANESEGDVDDNITEVPTVVQDQPVVIIPTAGELGLALLALLLGGAGAWFLRRA